MKKWLAVSLWVAIFAIVATSCFAAAATVTSTEYGYSITGGTDETMIVEGLIRIKSISYTAATANNVLTLRSGAVSGTSWFMKASAASNAPGSYIYFGERGALFTCLSVKLAEVTDVVQIFNQ